MTPENALERAAVQVFEELCFASVEGGSVEQPPSWDFASTVRFSGAASGTLVMRLAGVDVLSLASAMLGEEEGLDDSLVLDAVGELTNVVCGHALPLVVGARAVLDLTHPQVARDEVAAAERPGFSTFRFGLETGTGELELHFDEARS